MTFSEKSATPDQFPEQAFSGSCLEVAIFMNRNPNHQAGSGLSPGELRPFPGNDDTGVVEHSRHSPETLEARPDQGGLARQLPLWETLRRNRLLVAAIVIVVAILAAGGAGWWSYALSFESTDDAFIDTQKVQIGPALNGSVSEGPGTANQ